MPDLDLSPARFILFANAAFLLGLAVLVLTRRPRRLANLYFAAWAVCLGFAFASYFIVNPTDPAYPPFGYATAALLLAAAASHVGLVLHAPRPLSRRRTLLVPGLLLAGYLAIQAPLLVGSLDYRPMSASWAADWTRVSAHLVYLGVAWAATLLLAVRGYRAAEAATQRRYALFGATVATFPAWLAGLFITIPTPATFVPDEFYALFGFFCALGVAATWLAASRLGRASRACRNAALYVLGVYLAGMLLGAYGPPFALGLGLGLGWALVASAEVMLLTYAVLREQILGLDLKVKWTIKQSTMAAIFIGLFFIVSESAAAFFSDRVGTYVGIVAAGGLVFVIAPLQHFAQRVADRAMPGVKAVGEMTGDERLDLYRAQLAAAYSDGAVDHNERRLLETLRTQLDIAAEDAIRLEREVVP